MGKLRYFVLLGFAALLVGCTTAAPTTTRTSPRSMRTSVQPIDKVMNEPMQGIVGAR